MNINEESFYMPIEDVFTIKGRGAVVVGVIERGRISVGDTVEICSMERKSLLAQVAGIEKYKEVLVSAKAGDGVGILLLGIDRDQVEAGMVLCEQGNN